MGAQGFGYRVSGLGFKGVLISDYWRYCKAYTRLQEQEGVCKYLNRGHRAYHCSYIGDYRQGSDQ